MRLLLTLCSLAAVVYAKPQYNYGTGISGTNGNGFSLGSSIGGGFLATPNVGSSFGSGSSLVGPAFGSSSVGGVGYSSGGLSSGGLPNSGFSSGGLSSGGLSSGGFSSGGFSSGGASGFSGSSQGANGFGAPIVHKQFYTVAAAEDNENLEHRKHFVIGRPQKNYRVVFIKAPSSGNANVKLSAEYAPHEEKTAIYVLTKKDSALEVNDIATPAPAVPSKPEVFFIKYKTDEEAQHAQKTIQAEYDKIEGTSEHADGGVGSVQSVIGSLDGGAGAGVGSGTDGSSAIGSGVGGGVSSAGAKSPTYLPPGK